MLLSLSHGAGAPMGGWKHRDAQTRQQGAMSFGAHLGGCLTGEQVARGRFLPGGFWFYFACFGAGTPAKSAYWHWLRASAFGKDISDSDLLNGLAADNPHGFIAALPKAALANPEGPLAVIGHIDLAWDVCYTGPSGKKYQERLAGLTALSRENESDPARIGPMFGDFTKGLDEANHDLTEEVDRDKRLERLGGAVAGGSTERAIRWMERQDLAAYILLGDPTTHLPIRRPAAPARTRVPEVRSAPVAPAPRPQSAPPEEDLSSFAAPSAPEVPFAGQRPDVLAMERVVFEHLVQGATLDLLAARLGLAPEEVRSWVTAYQAAGRAALGDLKQVTIGESARRGRWAPRSPTTPEARRAATRRCWNRR